MTEDNYYYCLVLKDMREEYDKLFRSGMFWEVYPELSGNYMDDFQYWKKIYEHRHNM